MTISEEIDTTGFCVVPGVLTTEQLAALRAQALTAIADQGLPLGNGLAIPNAAARVESIRWLVTHPPVLEAITAAVGSADIRFTCEADIHCDFVAGQWHKDTGEKVMEGGYFGCDPIGRDDCRVFKVAFYLQDHSGGGGLNVRPGSHRTALLDSGTPTPVLSRSGDAVLFDVRLTHRGRPADVIDKAAWLSTRLTSTDRRASTVASRRARWRSMTGHAPRVAVYLAYGLANDLTDTFARRNHRRQTNQTGQLVAGQFEGLCRQLEIAGLRTVDVND